MSLKEPWGGEVSDVRREVMRDENGGDEEVGVRCYQDVSQSQMQLCQGERTGLSSSTQIASPPPALASDPS
jgi:hypothetical protein